MNSIERQRFQIIREVFDEAAATAPGPAREELLRRRCVSDPSVREEIERLLAQDERENLVLDQSPLPPSGRRPGAMVARRYRLVKFLASGGMGEVWSAQDMAAGGVGVALKFVRPGASLAAAGEIRARFRREARLAQAIQHPNVCRMLDYLEPGDEEDGICVMELLEGETLADRLARVDHFSEPEARSIVLQLCAGLAAAHRAGVLHRDLKPGNILLEPDGRAVIIDFGLAAAVSPDSTLTLPGAVIGTLAYMAPEQMEDGGVTAAADLYALGAIAYEMLTGVKPHGGATPLKVAIGRARAHRHRPLAGLGQLPSLWREVIGGCLRRDPAKRWGDAAVVAERLKAGRASWRFWARQARCWSPLAAAAVLLLAMGGWNWWTADYVPSEGARRLYEQALAALNDAAPDEAVRALEGIVGREPRFLAASALLAVAHQEAGRLDPARQAILIGVAARDAAWRVGRGEAWKLEAARAALTRDYRAAAERYGRLADAEAQPLERLLARLLFASMLERDGRPDEARWILENLVRESGSPAARERLARLQRLRASSAR